jgi:hypothetical protein
VSKISHTNTDVIIRSNDYISCNSRKFTLIPIPTKRNAEEGSQEIPGSKAIELLSKH